MTPTYHLPPELQPPDMSFQLATFQQSMFEQQQRQMDIMQQQFQMTLETSIKTVSETVARALAATVPQNNVQTTNVPHTSPPPPPEISCNPTPNAKDNMSDYQSATSSIPAMPRASNNDNTTGSAESMSNQQDMMKFLAAIREQN